MDRPYHIYAHVPESTVLGALLTANSPHAAAAAMKAVSRSEYKDDTARRGFVPADVEAGRAVFPLAAVGPKQDSITQAHVGKGE